MNAPPSRTQFPPARLPAHELRHLNQVPATVPQQAARAVRAGAILAPERAVGRMTWEAFLAERASSRHGRPERRATAHREPATSPR
jgi:hypothetical protein